jgi:ribosomal protein S18 acetylase RimI-like enzyme
VLGDPERHILQPGGAIFFARLGEEVIGTCALLQESPGMFELTKMGVDETFRGLGAGRRLLDACIAEFHRRKGHTLFLESNSRLTTALRMYEKAGFVMQPSVRPGSHYERADVYMIYRKDR